MGVLAGIDGWTRRFESRSVGRLQPDAWLLLARVLLGLPLVMNGVGQLAMPALMAAQMDMVGLNLAWKWPAILASLLGGLCIVVGWRIRLAAALLVLYVIPATLLFHNTHTLVRGDDPLAVPELALRMCRWYVYDFKDVASAVSDDFLKGCAAYRLFFDGAKTMDHFTMLIPALLLMVGAGAGRFSLDHRFQLDRKV